MLLLQSVDSTPGGDHSIDSAWHRFPMPRGKKKGGAHKLNVPQLQHKSSECTISKYLALPVTTPLFSLPGPGRQRKPIQI